MYVDIHNHLLPRLDDGPEDWAATLRMAEMAVADGIGTIIATPHQWGVYRHVSSWQIRRGTERLRAELRRRELPLDVVPGAQIAIGTDLEWLAACGDGRLLTLAEQGRHLLVELPRGGLVPLVPAAQRLARRGLVCILAQPERNRVLLDSPALLDEFQRHGVLLQVTAASLLGSHGPRIRQFAERLVQRRQVDFVASDAHDPAARRPLLSGAFERVLELAGEPFAARVFRDNPAAVAAGRDIESTGAPGPLEQSTGWPRWLPRWAGTGRAA